MKVEGGVVEGFSSLINTLTPGPVFDQHWASTSTARYRQRLSIEATAMPHCPRMRVSMGAHWATFTRETPCLYARVSSRCELICPRLAM